MNRNIDTFQNGQFSQWINEENKIKKRNESSLSYNSQIQKQNQGEKKKSIQHEILKRYGISLLPKQICQELAKQVPQSFLQLPEISEKKKIAEKLKNENKALKQILKYNQEILEQLTKLQKK